MGDKLTYGYVGEILKYDEQPDGSLMVYGVATSPAVDLDAQSCDPEWLKQAMPKWFKHANVREQHSSIAAGVGKELTHAEGDRWMLKTHVVDANTVNKVKAGVLKGYSVGIRNGRVLKGKAAGKAVGGVINGGDIVEISLVDRPCNPEATISIAKSVDGELVTVDAAGEVVAVVEPDGAQGVDDGVDDGPEVDFAEDGDELSLFDGLDLFDDRLWIELPADHDDERWAEPGPGDFSEGEPLDDADEVLKALGTGDDADGIYLTKGVLDFILNGPGKKDGDGDGKTGEGKRSSAESLAAKRRRLREQRAKELADARRHRDQMDSEAARDSLRAGKQGRRLEQAQHARRMGHYDKALDVDDATSGLSLAEHREAQRLTRDVLAGEIVKSAGADVDAERDAEVVGTIAELAIAELEELAAGAYDDDHDPWLLLDAVGALAKMFGREPSITKAAGSVVDTSPEDGVTLADAEIVKAAVSQATQALQGQIENLTAQLAEISQRPIPGGPMLIKSVQSAPPAPNPAQQAAQSYAEKAAHPGLAPDVARAYAAAAQLEAAKG